MTSASVTGLVLFLVLILSLFSALVGFFLLTQSDSKTYHFHLPLVPTIILFPLISTLCFIIFHQTLLFPSLLLASGLELVTASLIPSLMLLVGSGILSQLWYSLSEGVERMKSKCFFTFGRSLGFSTRSILIKPVMFEAFIGSWTRSLPFVFGELVVVEALFNIPGLGSLLWRSCLERDFIVGGFALCTFLIMYFAAVVAGKIMDGWIGRKFESY